MTTASSALTICALFSNSTIQHSRLVQLPKQLWLQEFAHADIFTQTLPPSGLEHEIPRRCLSTGRLEWTQLDVLIQRVAGNYIPPIEDQRERDGALGMDTQI